MAESSLILRRCSPFFDHRNSLSQSCFSMREFDHLRKIKKIEVYQSMFDFNEIKINKVKLRWLDADSLEFLKFWKFSHQRLSDVEMPLSQHPERFIEPFLTNLPSSQKSKNLSICFLRKWNSWHQISSLLDNWLKNREDTHQRTHPLCMYTNESTFRKLRHSRSDLVSK